ncbi:PIG-L family deacetylase [Jannaschia sp. LMIT008]|uniref:PIG-L deacetylase family protein n=1 Tax=Jannaschia maritima TaxID=3032585 RepID=UPI002810F14B|nr:PIG-L family deacetylase [Jannaschia sp. LMIT008]
MDDLTSPHGPVLVLAPHADDESLGCGMLLADLWCGGGRAHVACLTDGAASHPRSRTHPPARLAAIRRHEMRAAIARLGGTDRDVTFLDLPDAGAHRVHGPGQDPARTLAALVDRLGAAVLVAPSPLDPHCDHDAGARAARAVAAMRPGLRLLLYPIWSRWIGGGTAPVPWNGTPLRFDAPRHRARKAAAIAAHASQRGRVVRDDPDGFAMPPGFADHFVAGPEPFFAVAS